jgi:hypothetical protein
MSFENTLRDEKILEEYISLIDKLPDIKRIFFRLLLSGFLYFAALIMKPVWNKTVFLIMISAYLCFGIYQLSVHIFNIRASKQGFVNVLTKLFFSLSCYFLSMKFLNNIGIKHLTPFIVLISVLYVLYSTAIFFLTPWLIEKQLDKRNGLSIETKIAISIPFSFISFLIALNISYMGNSLNMISVLMTAFGFLTAYVLAGRAMYDLRICFHVFRSAKLFDQKYDQESDHRLHQE